MWQRMERAARIGGKSEWRACTQGPENVPSAAGGRQTPTGSDCICEVGEEEEMGRERYVGKGNNGETGEKRQMARMEGKASWVGTSLLSACRGKAAPCLDV